MYCFLGPSCKSLGEKNLDWFCLPPGEEGAQRGSVEVMIQGVPCRPRELLQRQHELEAALDQVSLYQEPKVQYRVRLQQKSSFKQPWSVEEDGHLVLGMLEYGFGSWHQIRTDPTLCLKDKKDLQVFHPPPFHPATL